MKKFIVGALLAIVCLQPAAAQKQHPAQRQKPTPEQLMRRMDKALSLNEKQEKQILEIYKDFFEDRKEGKSMTREDRKAMRTDLKKKISDVLTEEQMVEWKKIEKEQANKRKAAQAKRNKGKKQNK